MKTAATIVFFVAFFSSAAHAYCREPGRAPEPPRYDKPRPPMCLRNAPYGQEPECDGYELERFQRETDRYIEKLQEYADASQQYAQEALRYAQCEASEARAALNP